MVPVTSLVVCGGGEWLRIAPSRGKAFWLQRRPDICFPNSVCLASCYGAVGILECSVAFLSCSGVDAGWLSLMWAYYMCFFHVVSLCDVPYLTLSLLPFPSLQPARLCVPFNGDAARLLDRLQQVTFSSEERIVFLSKTFTFMPHTLLGPGNIPSDAVVVMFSHIEQNKWLCLH